MPAVSGSPTQASSSVDTPALLAAVPSAQFKRGDMAFVRYLADGVTPYEQLFVLLPDSVIAADGLTVIAAANGGRWVLASFVISGLSGVISVPTTAALAAFGGGPAAMLAAGADAGIWAYVQSQKAYYTLNATTSAWDRILSDAVYWTAQPTFYVALAGLPDNTGVAIGSPITFTELTARLYSAGNRAQVSSSITINFIDAVYSAPVVLHATILPGGQIVMQGTRATVVGGASAFTAFTGRVASTNTPNKGTDATQNWPGNIGNLIVDTQAGANFGAAAWVVKLDQANVGRLSSFMLFSPTTSVISPTEVTPGATDTYVIQTMTQLTGTLDIEVDGDLAAIAGSNKVILDSFNFAQAGQINTVQSTGPLAYITNSTFTNGTYLLTGVSPINCMRNGGTYVMEQTSSVGTEAIYGGAALATVLFLLSSVFFVRNGFLVQGVKTTIGNNLQFNVVDMGVFDFPAGAAITTTDGGTLSIAAAAGLWGASAVAGSQVFEAKQNSFVLNETAGTWALAVPATANLTTLPLDLSTTAAPVSATTWANLAVQNLTIANLDLATGAAGFGGRVVNNRGGSGFSRSDVV